jgi:hypothetical protein
MNEHIDSGVDYLSIVPTSDLGHPFLGAFLVVCIVCILLDSSSSLLAFLSFVYLAFLPLFLSFATPSALGPLLLPSWFLRLLTFPSIRSVHEQVNRQLEWLAHGLETGLYEDEDVFFFSSAALL